MSEENKSAVALADADEKAADAVEKAVETDTNQTTADAVSESEDDVKDKQAIYFQACSIMGDASTSAELETAEKLFSELGDFIDSVQKSEKCRVRKEALREKETELAEKKARLDKLRMAEYNELKDEAKRIGKILKSGDAAKRYREIAEIFEQKYSDIEGASDYAREYMSKSEKLKAVYEKRKRFEKISCITACCAEILSAVLFVMVFFKLEDSFKPFVPMTLCCFVMFSGFLIGYTAETEKGSAPSFLGAFGFVADEIALIILSLVNKSASGIGEYARLFTVPVLIGFAAGVACCIVWNVFAKKISVDRDRKD